MTTPTPEPAPAVDDTAADAPAEAVLGPGAWGDAQRPELDRKEYIATAKPEDEPSNVSSDDSPVTSPEGVADDSVDAADMPPADSTPAPAPSATPPADAPAAAEAPAS